MNSQNNIRDEIKKINIGNWYNNQKMKINNKDCDIYI